MLDELIKIEIFNRRGNLAPVLIHVATRELHSLEGRLPTYQALPISLFPAANRCDRSDSRDHDLPMMIRNDPLLFRVVR